MVVPPNLPASKSICTARLRRCFLCCGAGLNVQNLLMSCHASCSGAGVPPATPANKSRTQGTVYNGTIEQYPPSAPERLAIDDAAYSSKEGNCASQVSLPRFTAETLRQFTVLSYVKCRALGPWVTGKTGCIYFGVESIASAYKR